MSSNVLTAADFAKLTAYAANSDCFDYWNLLGSLGDNYAKLALEVVNGNTITPVQAQSLTFNYLPTSWNTDGETQPPVRFWP